MRNGSGDLGEEYREYQVAEISCEPLIDGLLLIVFTGAMIRADLSSAGYREISRAQLIDPTWPFDRHGSGGSLLHLGGKLRPARSQHLRLQGGLLAQMRDGTD